MGKWKRCPLFLFLEALLTGPSRFFINSPYGMMGRPGRHEFQTSARHNAHPPHEDAHTHFFIRWVHSSACNKGRVTIPYGRGPPPPPEQLEGTELLKPIIIYGVNVIKRTFFSLSGSKGKKKKRGEKNRKFNKRMGEWPARSLGSRSGNIYKFNTDSEWELNRRPFGYWTAILTTNHAAPDLSYHMIIFPKKCIFLFVPFTRQIYTISTAL